MALTGVQPRSDSAVSGDVPVTNMRQPSTLEWYASTIVKTVFGEAVYRSFDWTDTLRCRNLDFLPNPVEWFGANAAEVGTTIGADPAIHRASIDAGANITRAALNELGNDSKAAAAAAETAQVIAENATSSWFDWVPEMPTLSMPTIPDWVGVPSFSKLPSISMPSMPDWVGVPSFVKMPSISMPSMPDWVGVPSFVKMPSISMPSMPDWVGVPSFANMPSVSWPSTTWVTTPLSYLSDSAEQAWSYLPNLPATPQFIHNGLNTGKNLADWGWTQLENNIDWVGPTAAVALSSAAFNHIASSRIKNAQLRYTLSSFAGVVSVWGASELAALALGAQYQVGFEKAADLGLRMMITGFAGQIASPLLSKGLELANRVVVEPLSWSANLPVERSKVKVS